MTYSDDKSYDQQLFYQGISVHIQQYINIYLKSELLHEKSDIAKLQIYKIIEIIILGWDLEIIDIQIEDIIDSQIKYFWKARFPMKTDDAICQSNINNLYIHGTHEYGNTVDDKHNE